MRRWALTLICLGALGALSACGDDGYGNYKGWGGYTKQYGDADYGYKPVGLCSYLGGCMEKDADDSDADTTSAILKSRGDSSGSHASGTIDSQ